MKYRIVFIDTSDEPIFCTLINFVPRIGERIFRTVTEVYTVIDVLYVMVDGLTKIQLVNIIVRRKF